MAVNSSVDGERRRRELVEHIQRAGEISLEQAASEFEVSSMTIRRDLEILELEGALKRVRGGAVSATGPRSYDERLAMRGSAKRAIAKKALELVPLGGAIALDASTTVNALAEMLGDRGELTACTNSVQTFELLTRLGSVTAHLTGGTHEPVTGSLVGPIANAGARLLHTRVFFTSADGVSPEGGSSEASLAEAEVKRHLSDSADRTVLCVDSSKLGKRSTGMALRLAQVATLITELDPNDPRLDPYRDEVEIR
ncbi:DeoR/GlpR family DNA-binding transcription regulator [Leucobacter luti]|uniref:DeoR family transcriptional regulator n=1 Tax=Leucobacter luti TaxID=340320 RepID=A0A4R6S1J1_9MICO|nr:DeoR/GlpR family DNA-binding transcription regulator [Leucobacter luti]MCW2289211.1 DeoR family fructose operon transcriptional repressor [Leucobacter luti]QYM74968.1 DeoR/GlpR family DNA-binding transcription regulator [Leucobacter luti]TCK39774.1 DeoR family transcriptional regulator [Leucobacter luti]TDP93380.1 DeoR family transcriptional regulator [Leucobacter luti]